jgi:AraC-like DNA-binding protein
MNRAFVSPEFRARVARLFQGDEHLRVRGVGDMALGWGLERHPRGERYAYDGLKRGVDPAHPILIFKYTLAGWGNFAFKGRRWRVRPGQVFMTRTPAPYRFGLPARSPEWSFFWVSTHHRYVVERVFSRLLKTSPVFSLADDSPLMGATLNLLGGVLHGRFPDFHAREEALFRWMCECERTLERQIHPPDQREQFLEMARKAVMSRLSRPLDVSAVAAACGLSRTHFSHRFRRATGRSPAAWMAQVRTAEAERRLRETSENVETIAAQCGFGSSTQFGRVFRRHYHMTPALYRASAGTPRRGGGHRELEGDAR